MVMVKVTLQHDIKPTRRDGWSAPRPPLLYLRKVARSQCNVCGRLNMHMQHLGHNYDMENMSQCHAVHR